MRGRNRVGQWGILLGGMLLGLVITGCHSLASDPQFAEAPGPTGAANTPAGGGSNGSSVPTATGMNMGDMLKIGDSLNIVFSDLSTPVPPIQERIKEDGTITLIHNQTFTAAGKTRGELEKEIRERYVPKMYRNMTVMVNPQERVFYVGGEVRQPGQKLYTQPITVLQAIQSSGDFTDFAQKKRIHLTRANGEKKTINANDARKDPRRDLPVYPGDTIHVPRKFW